MCGPIFLFLVQIGLRLLLEMDYKQALASPNMGTIVMDQAQPETHQHPPTVECNPWSRKVNVVPTIVQEDLLLPSVDTVLDDNGCLVMTEDDFIPLEESWGFCLLGFYGGRFPGKEATRQYVAKWPSKPSISFHSNGWMVFRFATESERDLARNKGTQYVFGIPLVLCSMPRAFKFDIASNFKFRIWITLSGLPLEYWNPRSISKIASRVGMPIEVDRRTIKAENVDGPRVLVLVDALNKPVESFPIAMHDGTIFNQHVSYDFYPSMCSKCHRMGHSIDMCRLNLNRATRGASVNPPRETVKVAEQDTQGWQVQHGRRKKTASKSRGRSITKKRSRSRRAPSKNGDIIPAPPPNTHLRFSTPSSSQTLEPRPNQLVGDMNSNSAKMDALTDRGAISSSSDSSANVLSQYKIQYRNDTESTTGSIVAESVLPESPCESVEVPCLKGPSVPSVLPSKEPQVLCPTIDSSFTSDSMQVRENTHRATPVNIPKGGIHKPILPSKTTTSVVQRKVTQPHATPRGMTGLKGGSRIHRKGSSNPPPLSRSSALELSVQDEPSSTREQSS